MNFKKLRPMKSDVVVQIIDKTETTSEKGVYIKDEDAPSHYHAKVLAVGPRVQDILVDDEVIVRVDKSFNYTDIKYVFVSENDIEAKIE